MKNLIMKNLVVILLCASSALAVKTNPVNTDNPTDISRPSQGAGFIRTLAAAVLEMMDVDHYTSATNPHQDDVSGIVGQHKQVTFNAPQTDPALVDESKGVLYTKDVGTAPKAELCWIDEDEHVKQLTLAGKLNIAADEAVLLTGNQAIAGIKTLSSSPVIVNAGPALILGDSDGKYFRLANNANKLVVDMAADATFTPYERLATFETGEEHGMDPQAVGDSTVSTTMANGTKMTWGTGSATGGGATVGINHGMSNKCYKVFLTITQNTATNLYALKVTAISSTQFSVLNNNSATLSFDWFAIGY